MRGNSGFLRWLPSYNKPNNTKTSSSTDHIESHHSRNYEHYRSPNSATYLGQSLSIAIGLLLITASAYAGPVNHRERRMTREFLNDYDSLAQQNDTLLSLGTCLHEGQQRLKSDVQCDMKPGCRAIQKPDSCCPDYRCECVKDGKVYANGEKLISPENSCKVCYCQGGEITCGTVTCYIRDDCKPKYTGRCCPEYDNCPPLEFKPGSNKETSPVETGEHKETSVTASTLIVVEHSAFLPASSTTNKPEVANSNPLGIKIKEITKPEEIRIIDEKPKPYHLIKPFESSSVNQAKSSPPNIGTQKHLHVTTNTIETESVSPVIVGQSMFTSELPTPPASVTGSNELINKLENADVNAINDKDTQKIVRHTDALTQKTVSSHTADAEPEVVVTSSTVAAITEQELNDELQKTSNSIDHLELTSKSPLAIVGDKVLIYDQNGHPKPITLVGIEGLQRGDVVDETSEFDDKKSSTIKRSGVNMTAKVSSEEDNRMQSNPTTEGYDVAISMSTEGLEMIPISSEGPEVSISDIIYSGDGPRLTTSGNEKVNTEFDPIASSSDDFIRIVATTKRSDFLTFGSGSGSGDPFTIDGNDSIPLIGNNTSVEDDDEVHQTYLFSIESNEEGNFSEPLPQSLLPSAQAPFLSYPSSSAPADAFYHESEGPFHLSTNADPSYTSTSVATEIHSDFNHNISPYHPLDDDDLAPIEHNPAYPTIADDLSVLKDMHSLSNENEYDLETVLVGGGSRSSSHHEEDHNEKGKILPEVNLFKSNGTTEGPDTSESSNPNEWLKQQHDQQNTSISEEPDNMEGSADLESSGLDLKSPGEPLLIPEWERNATESDNKDTVLTTSGMDDSSSKASSIELTDDSIENGSGGGSGHSPLPRDKEPTTPRVSKFLNNEDIETLADNVESSSTAPLLDTFQHDPKDDAESLKLDDGDDNNATPGLAASVAKPSLQKTIESLNDFHRHHHHSSRLFN